MHDGNYYQMNDDKLLSNERWKNIIKCTMEDYHQMHDGNLLSNGQWKNIIKCMMATYYEMHDGKLCIDKIHVIVQ